MDAVVAGLGGVVAAAADHGDDALGLCGRDAHDGGHLIGRGLTARDAQADLRAALEHGLRIGLAAREAAAAAVRAGRASMSFGRRSSVFTAKTFEAMASTAPNTAPMMPSTSTA